VTIAVTASGNGIAADSLTRAFEPAEAGVRSGNGSGVVEQMSPATIYRLLQRCGGDLSVEVEPGKGSTFTVFLPCAAADADLPAPQPARVVAGPPA